MKQKEIRALDIYYCDVCGKECGLPYYGIDNKGYGKCCHNKIFKAERYLNAINRLRIMNRIPSVELTFTNLVAAGKRYE